MNKSTHFTGQPLFSQIIKLVPRSIVEQVAFDRQSDRYCKTFDTWHHLITMLFACYGNCDSIREVVWGMRALEGKLISSGVEHFPARTTLSDANKRRSNEVFEEIYYRLKKHFEEGSPDSRQKPRIIIFDSTTISLFKEIFRGSGLAKADGRKKGGLKVHVAIEDGASSPSLVHFSDGASNDLVILPELDTEERDFLVFDRGYRSYKQYIKWTGEGKSFVTRMKDNTYISERVDQPVSEEHVAFGIIKDQLVKIGHPNKKNTKLDARLVVYKDPETDTEFKLLTNCYTLPPLAIAGLYKKRWQIELLFKRLKQNMPLRAFLGDNQTAIKIQIWCALIADMLLQVIRSRVKRKWSFSNVVSVVRLHLFNYLNLYSYLEKPEKAVISIERNTAQIKLQFDD